MLSQGMWWGCALSTNTLNSDCWSMGETDVLHAACGAGAFLLALQG